MKVGSMKTHNGNNSYFSIRETGYNPKTQVQSNTYCAKYFHENTAVNNNRFGQIKRNPVTLKSLSK